MLTVVSRVRNSGAGIIIFLVPLRVLVLSYSSRAYLAIYIYSVTCRWRAAIYIYMYVIRQTTIITSSITNLYQFQVVQEKQPHLIAFDHKYAAESRKEKQVVAFNIVKAKFVDSALYIYIILQPEWVTRRVTILRLISRIR